jgi:hypothetical protein
MRIKVFLMNCIDESELIIDVEENIHISNMYLSTKSIYHDNVLYDTVESVLNTKDKEIQITVKER